MKKYSDSVVSLILEQADNAEFIYKLHMSQLRDTRKQFKDNAEIQQKLDIIEAKIKQAYKEAK